MYPINFSKHWKTQMRHEMKLIQRQIAEEKSQRQRDEHVRAKARVHKITEELKDITL